MLHHQHQLVSGNASPSVQNTKTGLWCYFSSHSKCLRKDCSYIGTNSHWRKSLHVFSPNKMPDLSLSEFYDCRNKTKHNFNQSQDEHCLVLALSVSSGNAVWNQYIWTRVFLHWYCPGTNLDFLLSVFFLTNSPQQAAGSGWKQQQDGHLQVHFNGSHRNSAVIIFLPAISYVKTGFFQRVMLTNKQTTRCPLWLGLFFTDIHSPVYH